MRVRLGRSKSPMHWGDLEVTVLVSRTIVLVPNKTPCPHGVSS